ncbi:class I SAM-dependent methyltransferase [Bacillus shivajii]|uniref:class I SAM-dependent methyltransferase n=1 Tax=Bacillus shivajii TaxID=1983719 RepID=UPI001CFA5F2A|nr:class I SAM-dependent methyltransferase [Bacillus shivajii]UCZ52280.1 class I SAM-dependent methyltransferase [Bacillus shivajii]
MQAETKTEKLYQALDEGAILLKSERNIPYLDALGEMGEVLYYPEMADSLSLDELKKKKLQNIVEQAPALENLHKEESRRAVQLAVLKGMKEGTQPHHAMTPDAVSLFVGYLVEKVLSYESSDKPKVLLDPAVGAGNLLMGVMNQLKKESHAIGAEADETLLKLAYVNANLQSHNIDLFHQDSVASPFVQNVDAVISDLPVGFYPNDDISEKYSLKADEGHSYVHHLLIEQSMNHVKEGGFLFFIVPNFLFESEEAKKLHDYLKSEGYIYSLMQLPKTMFKNDQWGKSILILRKRKEGVQGPKQALLAELPSFSNEKSLQDMMKRISDWFDDHLSK